MTNKDQSEMLVPISARVQQASADLRWGGRIGFWVQLVLGVVSTVFTLLSVMSIILGDEQSFVASGSEFAVFCSVCGLVALAIGIYFSLRYMAIAQLLQTPDTSQRPKRADTISVIRIGLTVNMVGMLVTIVGAEAIVGIVLFKSLRNPATIVEDTSRLVNSIDLLVVQANTNTIAAHFSGIVSSLLLLNRITR